MMKGFLLLVALLCAEPAFAREIDFSKKIVDLDGKPIPSTKAEDAPALDLKTVAEIAILSEKPQDPRDPRSLPPDPTEKLKRFALALKIHHGGVVDVSAEEIAQIKSAISNMYNAFVFGRAVEILDPEQKP